MFIIKSLLDMDLQPYLMAQVAWLHHRDVPVRYGFTNRTRKVPIARYVPENELRFELGHVRNLHFQPDELEYLRTCRHLPQGLFRPEFLEFLRTLRLPPIEIERTADDQLRIETEGPWPEAIFWETIILSVVNELYYRSLLEQYSADTIYTTGRQRLRDKISTLRRNRKIRFTDFGNRRRFSRMWQEEVVEQMLRHVPSQLAGTSNVRLAHMFDLPPVGTMAHEMFMVQSGIDRARDGDTDDVIRNSHGATLDGWYDTYGEPLSLGLTDTYGSEFFFRDFGAERAREWRGLRQDSGDPIAFGERAIEFYKSVGVDPKTKIVVFSDGLDIETIVRVHERFNGRIKTGFGWGTNLTNDLGLDPLSIVVKATRTAGFPTVKLSNNLAKAMGPAEEVERFRRIFNHTGTDSAECRY